MLNVEGTLRAMDVAADSNLELAGHVAVVGIRAQRKAGPRLTVVLIGERSVRAWSTRHYSRRLAIDSNRKAVLFAAGGEGLWSIYALEGVLSAVQ